MRKFFTRMMLVGALALPLVGCETEEEYPTAGGGDIEVERELDGDIEVED